MNENLIRDIERKQESSDEYKHDKKRKLITAREKVVEMEDMQIKSTYRGYCILLFLILIFRVYLKIYIYTQLIV